LIQHGSDRDVAGLLGVVRETNEDPKQLLRQLASHGDPTVRGWALSAIGETIGTSGMDIVRAHAKSDRDSDVRDIAIQALLVLDIDAARSLIPVYRRRLRSSDRYEPVTAMWALAAIGDTSCLDEIRALGEAATRGLHKHTATVVCMILEGRSHDVLAAIQGHNHDLMPWLVKGARIIATPEARRVLEECAESSFDDVCTAWCRKEAEYLARRSMGAGGRSAL
jgi:HEAT repeat protein